MTVAITPTVSTYSASRKPPASAASYTCRVRRPESVRIRWITSMRTSGRSVTAVWVPVTAQGDNAAFRSLQSLQSVAARVSFAIATRTAPVHHSPGAASIDWWAREDSNLRPTDYESAALTD